MAPGQRVGYAPHEPVTKTILRYREHGFAGQPINDLALRKLNIPDTLIPRTLATLRFLDLIDAGGQPTDQFNILKNATTAEFPARLAEWLKATYAPVFGFCDPATATAAEIEDAFRGCDPEGQRARMATLFVGLATFAGIIEVGPVKPRGIHAAAAKKKPAAKPKGATAAPNTTKRDLLPPPPNGAYVNRYLELLIAKVESQDEPDPTLLDRIERALGITDSGGSP